MGILRLIARTMGRISTFRSYQFVLLLAAALAVVGFYYFASEKQNFSSTTKRIKQNQASHINRNGPDLTADIGLPHAVGSEDQRGEERKIRDGGNADHHFHALMMFTKVDKSRSLQDKFKVAMLSMVKHGRFLEGELLVLHFVSDEASKELGERMLQEFLLDAAFKYEVGILNTSYTTLLSLGFSIGRNPHDEKYSIKFFVVNMSLYMLISCGWSYVIEVVDKWFI